MAEPNWLNRTLYHADNLDVMRGMNSDTVDLIATDPPFNKSKDFHATPDSLARGASFQDRWSWENDIHDSWVTHLQRKYPRLMEAIESAKYAHSPGMGAYMCFMAIRLIEMHRVLKPTGSIYLHCDPTASHYLKACMDAIFGWKWFRNDIIWCYRGMTPKQKRWQNKHDNILFYADKKRLTFNVQYGEPTAGSLKTYESMKRVGYNANHKRLMAVVYDWDKYNAAVKSGRIPEGMRTTEFRGGRPPMMDWWTDIKILGGPKNKERKGYPTQKPLALYERIITASSNEGDVVLDPFAGCATTCVAAERLGRQWVGIDIWEGAHQIVLERITEVSHTLNGGKVYYTKEPPYRSEPMLATLLDDPTQR